MGLVSRLLGVAAPDTPLDYPRVEEPRNVAVAARSLAEIPS
jgi:hypothetical protein